MKFPIFKTKKEKTTKKFNLADPKERADYFQLKAGPEIAKLREYLKKLAEDNPQDKESLERISNNVTHTPTTVEIMPAGVNKLKTLREIAGNNVKIYFGDADTDRGAMEVSDVNVAPSNSESSIKNYTKGDETREFFGILPDKSDLEGVNDSLKSITTYFRLKNIEKINRNKKEAKPEDL